MCEGRPPRHCGWAPFVRITACCFRESKGRAPVPGIAASLNPYGEALPLGNCQGSGAVFPVCRGSVPPLRMGRPDTLWLYERISSPERQGCFLCRERDERHGPPPRL